MEKSADLINVVNAHWKTIIDAVLIVASILFVAIGFDRSSVRAGWAKVLFILVSLAGITLAVSHLLEDNGLIVLTKDAVRTLYHFRLLLRGFALGLILALIASQQLLGTKRH